MLAFRSEITEIRFFTSVLSRTIRWLDEAEKAEKWVFEHLKTSSKSCQAEG
jgi:hypothetical protein